jgi:hypothetical protein
VVSITALTQGEGFHSSITKDRGEFDLSSRGLEKDVVVAVHVEDGMTDGAWIDGRFAHLSLDDTRHSDNITVISTF